LPPGGHLLIALDSGQVETTEGFTERLDRGRREGRRGDWDGDGVGVVAGEDSTPAVVVVLGGERVVAVGSVVGGLVPAPALTARVAGGRLVARVVPVSVEVAHFIAKVI
jgi:hypothetical protein